MLDSNVDVVQQRQFSFNEIELLGLISGFNVVDVKGDFDEGVELDNEEAYRAVVCLVKK